METSHWIRPHTSARAHTHTHAHRSGVNPIGPLTCQSALILFALKVVEEVKSGGTWREERLLLEEVWVVQTLLHL